MTEIFYRNLNDEMNETQQKIKDKIVEMTNLGLTDKAEYHSYEEVYPFLLDKFVDGKYNLLEVGTAYGGTLRALSELFPESNIYGVDWDLSNLKINVEDFPNIQVFESHQCDSKFLDNLPMLDFVTEDASHIMSESIATFELLESKLNPGALYVIEDVYPEYYNAYLKDGRFKIYDVRDIKGRGDDVIAVYEKK
jgi:hypothetical protein